MRALHLTYRFFICLLKSLAILATNLLTDMPAEAVKPTSSKFVVLFLVLIAFAKIAFFVVTSRYASSRQGLYYLCIHKKFESY
jgi:hypothetical protein